MRAITPDVVILGACKHRSPTSGCKGSHRKIVSSGKVLEHQNYAAEIPQFVHDWLQRGRKGDMVFIFHNSKSAGILMYASSANSGRKMNSMEDGSS